MTTYFINFYPDGLPGTDPHPVAYGHVEDSSIIPEKGGVQIRVDIEQVQQVTVEVTS